MKMKLSKIMILASLCCFGLNAFAADEQDFDRKYYVKAAIAGAQTIKSTSNTTWNGKAIRQEFDSEKATALMLGVGGFINDYLRTELSVKYINKFSPQGKNFQDNVLLTSKGNVDLTTAVVMANVFVELAPLMGKKWEFNPYIGLGGGYARHKIDLFYPTPSTGVTYSGATTSSFAWNVVVGTSYDITDRIALDMAYTYSDYGKAKTGLTRLVNGAPSGLPLDKPFSVDVKMHELSLGIRYQF